MEYTYLPSIPRPLLNDFITGRVIPFVGAGFSKNADIPAGFSMPDWNELGKLAADEIPDYDYDNNAIDALSYYEDLYSRAKLVELLMNGLHCGKIQPGDTYKAFCDLFTGTICTTNFDFCDNKRKNTIFSDAYRLFDKGEYSACIVSAYSELEFQISSRYIEFGKKDYGPANENFRFEKYLRSHVESNNYNAYEIMKLRNRIVHQGYKATEMEAHDFLHLVEMVYEEDSRIQG